MSTGLVSSWICLKEWRVYQVAKPLVTGWSFTSTYHNRTFKNVRRNYSSITTCKPGLRGKSTRLTFGFNRIRRIDDDVRRVWYGRHHGQLGPLPSAAGFNNYEEEKEKGGFELTVPEYFNFASNVIDHWAGVEKVSDTRNGQPAFWWVSGENGREVRWTYQELALNSNRVANMLAGQCRLVPGDRVIVILPRIPQWWLISIACMRVGAVMISGTTQLTAKDIQHRIQLTGAKCVIVHSDTAEKVDEVLQSCPTVQTKVIVEGMRLGWFMFEDMFLYCGTDFQTVRTRSSDPMSIFFTSGTTGQPKMAEHTHASYGIGHRYTARYLMDLVSTDVVLVLADPGWAKCAWSLFTTWNAGACLFVDYMPKFDPERVLQVLSSYPVTVFCGPPTCYRMIVGQNLRKYQMTTLRHCLAGGEPLNPEVIERWLDGTGKLIYEAYGQTETVALVCTPRCLPIKLGRMGKIIPGFDVAIVDDNIEEVGCGVEGQIALRVKPHRPVGLLTRYVDDVERTASVFKGDFFLTGDRATKEEDGYFRFASRTDDVITSAGYRIGPFEVESALLEHEAVLESAVVSSPDETRGEVVKAFVVLKPAYRDADQTRLIAELKAHVISVTAPYKYPRKIEFVDALPKTVSGKTLRVELRKKEWSR